MTEFKLLLSKDAKEDLRRHLSYINRKYQNQQAIRSIRNDFEETISTLKFIAGSIREPENE